MKKRNLKSIFTAFALGAVTLLGGVISMGSVQANADETTETSTLAVQSGYKTGFFGEVSSVDKKLGATIEFDLYDTDFKELPYSTKFNVSNSSGTSGSLACVSFVFGKDDRYPYDIDPQTPAWHISNHDLTEYNFGGFQYFCNGAIKEWSYQGNSKVITDYLGDPELFMEKGYSYKVELRYTSFEYEGDQYGSGEPWFYVARKGIFEDESSYEMVFAYKKAVYANATFTPGTFAGMEVQGLCKKANVTGEATSADGKGHSVNMEIDNLRIYDGDSYETAQKKVAADFEDVTSEDVALPAMKTGNAFINKFDDKKYLDISGGIRCISANYDVTMGSESTSACSLTINSKTLFNVYFKDATTKETVSVQKTYAGLDFAATRIEAEGGKVYKFDYSEIDFSAVNGDIEVYGSPVSYFTLRLISGVDGVNDKSQRISTASGKYEVTENSLVRENYDLVGFATSAGGEVVYTVGDTVEMRCQDLTLYAVWQMKRYTISYLVDGEIINETVAMPRETPLYRGETPVKDGYVFVGWDKTVGPATQDVTISALFEKEEDIYGNNKALSIADALTFTRSGNADNELVEISFEAIKFPAGAKLVVCGQDVSSYVKEGYKVKLSLSYTGNLTVYTAYVNSENYEKQTSVDTGKGTNASISLAFNASGNEIIIDNLTASYDSKNVYVESFDGQATIESGLYKNYYSVEGSAVTKAVAKNIVVDFHDTTTERYVASYHTYQGASVELVSYVKGVSQQLVWDKTQAQLINLQESVTVNGALTWDTYKATFVVTDILGYKAIEYSIEDIEGIYQQTITLPEYTVGNYAIIGWSKRSGGIAEYTDEYTFGTASVTLYAVWGGKKVEASFYAEDGTTLLGSMVVEYNGTAIYEGEIPQKDGYAFVGWDKSTALVTENMKFIAQYEKVYKTISVSVLGGIGAGQYTEGETVTIQFVKDSGATSWEVLSGNVTLTKTNDGYTFVAGTEDVVIQAMGTKKSSSSSKKDGCSGMQNTTLALTLFTVAVVALVHKKRKLSR